MREKELDSFAKCSHSGCLWPLLVLAARFKEEQVKRKEDKNEERKGEKADRQRKRKRRRRGRRRHSMNSLVTTFHRDKRESRKEGRNVMLTWKKEVEKVQKILGIHICTTLIQLRCMFIYFHCIHSAYIHLVNQHSKPPLSSSPILPSQYDDSSSAMYEWKEKKDVECNNVLCQYNTRNGSIHRMGKIIFLLYLYSTFVTASMPVQVSMALIYKRFYTFIQYSITLVVESN